MAVQKVIVGLGNPGARYAKTRHNVGFMVADALAASWGVRWERASRLEAMTAEMVEGDVRCLLVKPQTFMNLSGNTLGKLVRTSSVEPSSILTVCDDIHLDVGQVRFRPEGSAGGHNGLRSIIESLGTSAFPRVRIGVGEPPVPDVQADYVLSAFAREEAGAVSDAIDRAAECCRMWLQGEESRAMTVFNQRKGKKGHE
ncbi:MAG: aminoacyl-tRNA hydrolase [Elusimicrobia bacterium]|nr:aminoacyl-tRNA hydrolase [Elusimicrobiota bacterium]